MALNIDLGKPQVHTIHDIKRDETYAIVVRDRFGNIQQTGTGAIIKRHECGKDLLTRLKNGEPIDLNDVRTSSHMKQIEQTAKDIYERSRKGAEETKEDILFLLRINPALFDKLRIYNGK